MGENPPCGPSSQLMQTQRVRYNLIAIRLSLYLDQTYSKWLQNGKMSFAQVKQARENLMPGFRHHIYPGTFPCWMRYAIAIETALSLHLRMALPWDGGAPVNPLLEFQDGYSHGFTQMCGVIYPQEGTGKLLGPPQRRPE